MHKRFIGNGQIKKIFFLKKIRKIGILFLWARLGGTTLENGQKKSQQLFF